MNFLKRLGTKTLEGTGLQTAITEIFEDTSVKYIQIHNAGPGCYNCQVDRVGS